MMPPLQFLFDQAIIGLTLGAEYALVAAGLALTFGVLGFVNFAHGEFYMLGAYVLYFAVEIGHLPYWLAALMTVAAMLVLGRVFYFLLFRRILNRNWQVQLVATLALSVFLANLVTVVVGSTPLLVYTQLANSTLDVGGMRVSPQRILILGAAILAFVAMNLYLRKTKQGKALRAVAQNREAARIVGIPIESVGSRALILGCGLAGVASATIPPLITVQPTMGASVVLFAFAAVVMGGFGNVSGTIISALLIGLISAFAVAYVASDYATLVVFLVMIGVLLFKPNGLFGQQVRL